MASKLRPSQGFMRESDTARSPPRGRPVRPPPHHQRLVSPNSPHGGNDYSAAQGTPVLAAADGQVVMVADQFFGGNAAFVDQGDGLISMYMHMSRVDVAERQAVRRGERMGAVGSSGRATGPHLHFGLPGGAPAWTLPSSSAIRARSRRSSRAAPKGSSTVVASKCGRESTGAGEDPPRSWRLICTPPKPIEALDIRCYLSYGPS